MPAPRQAPDIPLDLYITANSPGEIAGWVAPVVREIRPRVRHCRITLVILPCQYASGAELSYGAEIGVDRCVRIGDLGAITSDAQERTKRARRRLVLHMGGDFFFSVYLSKRLGCPLWAYASRPRWGRFVARFFIPDEGAERRFRIMNFAPERYTRIGNLALDSVVLNESEEETRAILRLGPEEPVLTCLSGSRPIEYVDGIPLFAKIARLLTDRFPDLRVFFPLAPTVREDLLLSSLSAAGIAWQGETRAHAIDLGNGHWAGIVRGRTLEVLNCSKLALAVPGTNNLQAAALYIPYIMLLPLDKCDEYPLDGLPGIVPLWLPGIRKFKRNYILRLNARTDFVSLPNKLAGRMIAPEIRGTFTPEDAAAVAGDLLSSPQKLQEISRAFWELTHERGASVRLAEQVAIFAKTPETSNLRKRGERS